MTGITSVSPVPAAPSRLKGMKWLRIKENIVGYLFIAPAVCIIGLFGLFPILYSIFMSLVNWRPRESTWVGLANYQKVLGDWNGPVMFIGGIFLFVLAIWVWKNAFRTAQKTGAICRWG